MNVGSLDEFLYHSRNLNEGRSYCTDRNGNTLSKALEEFPSVWL